MDFVDDGMCFACGKENKDGLQLEFTLLKDGRLRTEYCPPRKFQGYKDILHGGIMAVLLDETMIHLAFRKGGRVVTAQLEVRLRNPAKIGEKIIVTAELVSDSGRRMELSAEAKSEGGALLAQGKSTMVRI
ncbi:MAG: PaaI family thioesterase [candidate division NC10 bacterium]|nr:PaaI family thioesterase [candidate division NC10 bacterium]